MCRLTIVTLALSALLPFALQAQETPVQTPSTTVGAPPAVQEIPGSTQPAAEPPAPAPAANMPAEPNLKVTKDSGGISTSYLIKDAPLPSDFVMGNQNAPVTIVEYVSMSCPHCAHFSSTVLPRLEKEYIETGKVRYVLRQFPLNEPALKAAMLLDCVGEQDKNKYFVFSRVIFDAQEKWAFDGNFISGLETIATVGGLTKQQFSGCINNTDREMKILKAKQTTNQELKVPHTPYIFIGGEVYEGERSVEEVFKFIDAKLAQSPRNQ